MKTGSIIEKLKMIFSEDTSPKKDTTKKPAQRETYVFLTPRGKKFHYNPYCSSLSHTKPVKMDLSKAKKAGYSACDKCCYDYLKD